MARLKTTTCSIHLFGGMNPSIHHPLWYKSYGLIDEDEEEFALAVGGAMILPPPQPHSEFETRSFRIKCDLGRWMISTDQPEHIRRVFEIASKIFDETLPHTPVQEFWLVFNFAYSFTKARMSEALNVLKAKVCLDLGLEDPSFEEVTASEARGDSTLRLNVQHDKNTNTIDVTSFYEFRGITDEELKKDRKSKKPVFKSWTFGERLRSGFDEYYEESRLRAASIIAAI